MQGKDPHETNGFDDEKKAFNKYARYSGIGFQMIGTIGVFTYIGYRIDKARNSKDPIFTALLSVAGVCISLYMVIRSIKNLKP